ncbi:M23 family metallopeptidase [Bradyrhizobium sp. Ash2021]|uniref:M23 family metallopeptidase n=1 Tax=Bradyrhizobium sp. Ash2021 TaxID=2954771 RepID=UPI002815E87E|nr:M23 family metallopeptidase [Bradyrhizobium sp. Ash2021]WMT76173.1 M23 family metallopeptidase [Bradyrhizobium sp. Ash2021]
MSQKASRGSGYGRETGIIDLGHEPPLSVDGSEAAVIDRRRVSVQWFSGTILTGLCGAALIGGAVFASLDGEMTFAKVPERVEGALRGAFSGSDKAVSLHKSDRLPPPSESTAARNVVRVSTVTRVGNRDVMRVRPFIRISGNLSMTTSDLSAKIPPFNAQRMLTDVGAETPAPSDDPNDAAEPDAEVSFVTKDLAPVLPKAKLAAVVALDEVLMRVRDAANWRGNTGGVRYTALANATADASGSQSDLKMAYAPEGTVADPYAGFETRVVPENVTLLPKTKEQATGGNPSGERVHVVKKGDTVTSILRDQGATPDEAKAIAATLGPRGRDGGLKEGQKLRILMAPAAPGPGTRLQPYRVIVANDTSIEAVAALSDLGKYVAVDVQSMNTVTETADNSDDDDDDGSGVRLYQSIYETAMRNKVPTSVIEDMIRIYSYDVDFQRKVQPGDSFDVFYAGEDEGATITEKTEVLFAALTVGGETKKYYRFQTPDDSVVDYYDETGKSAKKFLVRKPVNNAIMRSGFGGRRHPILGYVKMHTGVDWATAYGTPIFASGNGVVEKVGPEGGYGKYVRLKHNNGYETAYGHMSAFAKGMEVGKRVRQGQVIGFVGSTGQSTGPHVHYEILVNGRFVDPMRVKLPRGRSLEGPVMASFEKERDRLDAQMSNRGGAARVSEATGTAPVRQVSNR